MNYRRGNWLLIIWFATVTWGMINIYGASYALNIAAGVWPMRPIIGISIVTVFLFFILF